MEQYVRYLQKLEDNLQDESSNDSDYKFQSKPESAKSRNLAELDEPNKNTKRNLRLPTRRPDPNIYNRNALLARENRRRKKAQLETMEKDLEEARRVNHNLLKALKKQIKTVKKLEEEKKYYRNVLMNNPEIQILLTALNSRLPLLSTSQQSEGLDIKQQEFLKIFKSPTVSISSSCSSSSSNAVEKGQEVFGSNSPQTDRLSKILRQDTFISPNYSSTYSEPVSVKLNDTYKNFDYSSLDSSWNELEIEDKIHLENSYINNELELFQYPQDSSVTSAMISDEDNYFSSLDNMLESSENSDSVGICLHIGRGKVTLEFCPDCHWSACQTPPDQLLQNPNAAETKINIM